MNLLTVLIILGFCVGNIFKFTLPVSEIKISFLDFGVILIWFVYLLKYKLDLFKDINLKNSLVYSLLMFVLVSVFSLFMNRDNVVGKEMLTGFSYLLRWTAYTLVFIPIQKLFSYKSLNILLYLVIISFTVVGIFQYIFVPDIRPLEILNWDPHLYRLVGSMIDPGFTALILLFSLIFIKNDKSLNSKHKYIIWFLIFVSLMLTYSRSGYLALTVSTIYISIKSKSIKYLLLVLFLFGVSIYFLPRPGGEGVNLERTSSIEARLINYSQTLKIFSLSPTYGTGFNLYRYTQRNSGLGLTNWEDSHAAAGADSSLLFVLATTGIVGFLIYLQFLSAISKIDSLTVRACLIAVLTHSWFLNSLFYPAVILFISLLIAHFNLLANRVPGSVSPNKD